MAGKKILEILQANGLVLTKLATQTSHATQGTRSTHAHGLVDHAGNALTPTIAFAVPSATDVDHVSTGLFTTTISIVKMDATNVYVRAGTSSQTFDLYVG